MSTRWNVSANKRFDISYGLALTMRLLQRKVFPEPKLSKSAELMH